MRATLLTPGAVLLVLALQGCSPQVQCPKLSANPDGSHTIAAPPASLQPEKLAGCEYEYDEDGNLGTERDSDG